MKIGHVKIDVQQYADGRWGFDDKSGVKRRQVRLWSKEKAEQQAADITVLLANARGDLLKIDHGKLQKFLKQESLCKSSPSIADACAEFLSLKKNKSACHLRNLKSDLKLFEEFIGPSRPIVSIMAREIQSFLESRDVSERRKFNLRAEIVILFRWAERWSYLESGRKTEAEKVERIAPRPGKPNVLTPDQMRTLIENIRPEYIPWLLISGFGGIRSEEIMPGSKSKKSPLRWEDFDWKHNVIIVRAETAKTKVEREVPLLPNLAQWLAPWRSATGNIVTINEQPSKRETTRVGKIIGGWKHNCLRDSFCSYRVRMIQNIYQVSLEMGNTFYMVQRSYHQRQPIEIAREWFDIRPTAVKNVVAFSSL